MEAVGHLRVLVIWVGNYHPVRRRREHDPGNVSQATDELHDRLLFVVR